MLVFGSRYAMRKAEQRPRGCEDAIDSWMQGNLTSKSWTECRRLLRQEHERHCRFEESEIWQPLCFEFRETEPGLF